MNANHLSDTELITRILAGHPDLFGPLVERHIRSAHAVAYARLGNATDAEDVVQEAFLRAYEKLGTLRDPSRFAAWLLTIARHEASRIAGKRLRVSPGDADRASDSSESLDTVSSDAFHPDPERHEMNALLRDHVMRLPESGREVLLLHYFAGHSARDIAALLDLRRSAVLKRLQRAREQLAETLLRDLGEVKLTTESCARQVARIVALTSALAVPTATVTATAAASAVVGFKIWAGAAATILIGAGALFALLNGSNAVLTTEPSQNASREMPAEEEVVAPLAAAPAETTPPSAAPNSVVAAVAQDEPAAVEEPSASDVANLVPNQNLDGMWSGQAYGIGADGRRETMVNTFEVTLAQVGPNVTIRNAQGEKEEFGKGTLVGEKLNMNLKLSRRGPTGRPGLIAQGDFSVGAQTILLRGTYITGEHAYTRDTDDGPVTQEPTSIPVELLLTRIPASVISRRDFESQKKREIELLYAAIQKYRKDHAGVYPTLEQLVPAYLASLNPYGMAAGVMIQYQWPTVERPDLSRFRYGLNEVRNASYHPELSVPDRLKALEADLAEVWGDSFLVPPLIVANYDQFDLQITASIEGAVSSDWPVPTSKTPRNPGITRTLCANNLKQLGLSLRMFMNEMLGNYTPGGWISAYPEFLPDRTILTCPGGESARMSYRLVWPTANVDELKQLYRDRVDAAASDNAAEARVPLVIETHDCSGESGRNVLFLDGHVTFFKGPLENQPDVAPFLNLK